MINPFALIKVYFQAKASAQQIEQEATKMDGAKEGWKTSTFWVKVFTVDIPVLYMGIKGFLPAKAAAIIEVSAMGVYAVYRTVVDTTKQIQSMKAGATSTTEVTAQTAVVNQ